MLLPVCHLQAKDELQRSDSPVVGVMPWMIALDNQYYKDDYTIYSSLSQGTADMAMLKDMCRDVNQLRTT